MDKLKYLLEVEQFGLKLKEIRLSRGLTQQSLSSLCDIDIRTIQRIEKGEQNITLKILFALANSLDMHPADLIQFLIKK